MNQALMMMYALGGRMDPAALRQMIQSGNDRRKALYVKLADILFAAVMFFFADLKLTVKKGDQDVDILATDKGITADEKLNALIGGMMQSDKGNRLREFFRPLIIAAAEILADLMAPNDMIVSLLGGGMPGTAAGSLIPSAAPGLPSLGGGSSYEGRLIQAAGDARVFHVVGGRRLWVNSWDTFVRRGYQESQVIKNLDPSMVFAIPEGPAET